MMRPTRLVLNHDNLDTSGASLPVSAAADDFALSWLRLAPYCAG